MASGEMTAFCKIGGALCAAQRCFSAASLRSAEFGRAADAAQARASPASLTDGEDAVGTSRASARRTSSPLAGIFTHSTVVSLCLSDDGTAASLRRRGGCQVRRLLEARFVCRRHGADFSSAYGLEDREFSMMYQKLVDELLRMIARP